MPDFQNAKIYKLWSPQGPEIYIGSTVNSLAKRKGGHKTNYNIGASCSSRILFEKYDDIRIELIEDFPCDNKHQLNKREGSYIRSLQCVNRHIAGRTGQEYYQQYKDRINQTHKEYNEANKSIIKEQRWEYYQNNKEEIKQRQREYDRNNRDRINQQSREYKRNNRDRINQKQRERYAVNKTQNKFIMTQDFEVIARPGLE